MSLKNTVLLVFLMSLVIGLAITGGYFGSQIDITTQPTQTQIFEDITPEEAFNLIKENQGSPDFVIIDVRTPEEFAGGHIENAINIDYYSDTFRDDLNKLDKNKTYLIYCRSGNRSGKALDIIEESDFLEAYNMLGGITAWQAEGLPVVE